MSWQRVPLEAIQAPVRYAFVGGPFGSKLTSRDYLEEGIPVIRGNNLTGSRFFDDEFVFVSEEKASRDLQSNMARPGDLVFTQRGTLGQVALIPESARFSQYVVSQSQMKLTVDPELADARFVYYYFRNTSVVQTLVNHAGSSGVPHINLGTLRQFAIDLPPLVVQERLADVLVGYDAAIENNRRRMALLEDAARQVYREWFVRLRFPGHEHVQVSEGVPAGWRRVPASDAILINPRTRLGDDGEHWSVEMADLSENVLSVQRTTRSSNRSGSKFMNGDTLFARITPCLENGKTGYVDFLEDGDVARGSTEFIVLRSKDLTPEYVYCLARTYAFRENAIKSMVGSSGRQRVQESCFDKFLLSVPPSRLLDLFTDIARPLFGQVRTLQAQNRRLRTARDLLLPRLMSGEIAV